MGIIKKAWGFIADLAWTRTRVVAVLGLITAILGTFGYQLSPELQEAIKALLEAVMHPVEPLES